MKVNRKEMIQALEASSKFRDKKSDTLPILELVKVDPDAGYIYATDLDAYAYSEFTAKDYHDAEKKPIVFVCNPEQLIGLLKSEAGDEAVINLSEDGLYISVGEIFTTIPTTDIEMFPDSPDISVMIPLFDMTAGQLASMIGTPAANDEKREHITHVHFKGDGKVVCTDIKRLNIVDIPEATGFEPFNLSKKALKAIRCLSKSDSINIASCADFGSGQVACIPNAVKTKVFMRPADAEFPQYEDLLKKHNLSLNFEKSVLSSACKKAMQIQSDEYRGCIFTFNGNLNMRMDNPNKGIYEERVQYAGNDVVPEEIVMALNPKFVYQAIELVDGDFVEMSIKSSEAGVHVSVPGDDLNMSIIMPMSI